MPKFSMKMKIQGFEIEIQGDRTDVPRIASSVGEQFQKLMEPTVEIFDGPKQIRELNSPSNGLKASNRKSARRTPPAPSGSETPALDWRHDPTKWGAPLQSWNTADKSIWLLYVVEQELGIKELSAVQAANTFNKHFRQAGQIRTHNVSRDLGVRKGGKDGAVGENTTASPPTWFLTDAGKKSAESLVKAAMGES